MSEPTDVPELSSAARDFLLDHAATGEPVPGDLVRVRARLLADASPVPARQERPEWARRIKWASALAASVALGAGLAVRFVTPAAVVTPSGQVEPTPRSQVQAVLDAYLAGDPHEAQRLAMTRCSDPACDSMAAALGQIGPLSARLDVLSPAELDELARLDLRVLSEGRESPIGRSVAAQRAVVARREPAPVDPARLEERDSQSLLARAQQMRQEQHLNEAAFFLRLCVVNSQRFYPCYRELGSTYAAIATRDSNAKAMEQAKEAYRRYLEFAPPDDAFVPKVQALLQASEPGVAGQPSTAPFGRFEKVWPLVEDRRARGQWREVGSLARQVLAIDPSNVRAFALLEEVRSHAIDTFLRAYRLRASDPARARALFQDVVDMLPLDDEYSQRARTQLKDLSGH